MLKTKVIAIILGVVTITILIALLPIFGTGPLRFFTNAFIYGVGIYLAYLFYKKFKHKQNIIDTVAPQYMEKKYRNQIMGASFFAIVIGIIILIYFITGEAQSFGLLAPLPIILILLFTISILIAFYFYNKSKNPA